MNRRLFPWLLISLFAAALFWAVDRRMEAPSQSAAATGGSQAPPEGASPPRPRKPPAAEERGTSSGGTASGGTQVAWAAKQTDPRIVLREKAVVTPAEEAFRRALKPRRIPAKEALRIPEGQRLRLTVKLADELAARANEDGSLSIQSSGTTGVEGLRQLVMAHDLRFHRMHTISDEQLADLTGRAARNSGTAQPDLAAHVEVVAPDDSRASLVALARALHALPEIEFAELESQDQPPPPPAVDIAPVTPLLVSNQTYRGASTGVNVDYVWNTFGIRGDATLRVTDCEYQYNPGHEDLDGLVQMQPDLVSMYTGFGDDHGTAVLGVITSGWNDYGTTGSVPECVTRFYPEFSTLTTGLQTRAACVTAAIAASASGDIVMLEMQADGPATGTTDYVMAEYDLGVWNAVRVGTDAGVITVAAAGNGNQNLDDGALFSAYNARGDSGAIIVGAGTSARAKLSFSTYGTRVNVQGWGSGVFTTGYGSHATYGSDPNQKYASGFSGTSSATPIVTSAAALLQSVAIKILGIRLAPGELRALLTGTGRAQTGAGASTTPIGPLPELEAAVAALFASHPPTFSTVESWALYHFATPTPDLEADIDQDGLPALLEYVLGTDPKMWSPTDAARAPHVSLITLGGDSSAMVFEFNQPAARIGATWVVQQSDSMQTNSWQDLVHGVDGVTIARTGDTIQVALPATAGRKFMRLKVTLN